jgi:hypothetical protein
LPGVTPYRDDWTTTETSWRNRVGPKGKGAQEWKSSSSGWSAPSSLQCGLAIGVGVASGILSCRSC